MVTCRAQRLAHFTSNSEIEKIEISILRNLRPRMRKEGSESEGGEERRLNSPFLVGALQFGKVRYWS